MIYGQPCLRGIAQAVPVDYPLDALQAQIDTLALVLAGTGVDSISATQIGLMLRLFLITTNAQGVTPLINPVIVDNSGQNNLTPWNDGCISIPGAGHVLSRYSWVDVQYQTIGTNSLVWQPLLRFSGHDAFLIQHEMDHLNGILFIDHLPNSAVPNSLGCAKGYSNLNDTTLSNIVAGTYSANYNTQPVTRP